MLLDVNQHDKTRKRVALLIAVFTWNGTTKFLRQNRDDIYVAVPNSKGQNRNDVQTGTMLGIESYELYMKFQGFFFFFLIVFIGQIWVT